jgi:hypothetical protein
MGQGSGFIGPPYLHGQGLPPGAIFFTRIVDFWFGPIPVAGFYILTICLFQSKCMSATFEELNFEMGTPTRGTIFEELRN